MKKLFTLLIGAIVISSNIFAQFGFITDYNSGYLQKVNLAYTTVQSVGFAQSNIAASDFGPNNILYAINSGTNNFIQIDTANGSATTISNIPPPANHIWTGMAYDDNEGVMYGISCFNATGGESSLHTIDCAAGTATLVGSQSTANDIGCIGIDDTGQMYGLQISAGSGEIYLIDKTTGQVTFLGYTYYVATGMGHGMDWSYSNNAMYLTSTRPYISQLFTINLSDGSLNSMGYLSGEKASLSVAPTFQALFSADTTTVCEGDTVNFSDNSAGSTSWLWSFEGGTPATSTDQNPSIVYNTSGSYDVSLIASNTNETDTTLVTNMITVNQTPAQPDTPSGDIGACSSEEVTYTTQSVTMADSYVWEVLPSDAGIITGSDTSAVFTASETWVGTYTIKVKAENSCGIGPWSPELNCTLDLTPEIFFMTGGGSYCENGTGSEVTLDGSETGVDYELFLDNVSTGTFMPGSGNPISFGYQTDVGIYTSVGYTSNCSETMFGEAYVSIITTPVQGTQPTGPENVCSGTTTEYQTDPITDADTLIWDLKPDESGVITGSGENISITWSETYYGIAYLSVYGSNECGDGTPSTDLEINVLQNPEPEITGETLVCDYQQNTYSTPNVSDNTYSWSVEGGDITNGSGTSEIDVLWGEAGNGYIVVTETTPDNCETTSDTLSILIDECIGISETTDLDLIIYPNPANEIITISSISGNNMEGELLIYNMIGQIVLQTNLNLINKKHQQLNISSLKTGLHIIIIKGSNNYVTHLYLEVY